MFVIHETLPNRRKLKYNAKPIYKIPSSFIWYWFFLIFKRHYYAFITNQMFKNTFFEWIRKQKF